jgi:DNA-binding NarL/FixJ family response regulator
MTLRVLVVSNVVVLRAEVMPLSRRELQIAQLIDCGLTNKQIGRRLGIVRRSQPEV